MTANEKPSVIGTIDTLSEGQVLLPGFVIKLEDGLYIDLSALDSRELFPRFVSIVFDGGACFHQLDYSLFIKLLYLYSPEDIGKQLEKAEAEGHPPHVMIARDIVAFPFSRLELYRGFKQSGEQAEYYFEQISLDTECEGGGVISERAYLNFDEFVAALWKKGIRFGIDEALVRDAIKTDKVDRLVVAKKLPPTPGHDATLVELTKALHRDDSPKLLSDGRVDLCHFSNRFPQVTAQTQLVKKVPLVNGISGWDILGKELAPDPLKDFEIEKMVGPGTRVVSNDAGEQVIIAEMDGFLDIDTKTSQFSISEKIVSRSGVSVKTTGDLNLSGDEFEEHGEVQEKRGVSGKHMTFFADVYGNVESSSGRVVFKKNLSGGSAKSPGGTIVVEGSASRAVLDAGDGTLEVAAAESSLLIGKEVRVGKAVCCNIVAEVVVIENSEGSAIAARSATITMASARKAEDTLLTMLIPDVAHVNSKITKLEHEKSIELEAVAGKRRKMAELTDQPDMKTYLSFQPRIKAGTLPMTPQQETNWKALVARLAPSLREYARMHGEIAKVQGTIAEIDEQIKTLDRECADALASVRCEITEVFGETIVRQRLMRSDEPPLASLPAKELHTKLHEGGAREDRIFFGDSGSLKWAPPSKAD